MGLFDDVSQFLEDRLEEYLRNNPHLELMAMEEKLREQEAETLKLMADLKRREQQLQDEILAIAQEIQTWHARIEKARAKGRLDLAEPAEAREAALLREGNQKWGKMEMVKERMQQTQDLQRKIQLRRKEVQSQVAEAQAAQATAKAQTTAKAQQNWNSVGWSESHHGSRKADPLDQQFLQWEAQEELEQMKRDLGK